MNSQTSNTSDKELAERAAAGDESAFTTLHDRHQRKIYALCLRMTGNVSEAEDMVQETFIQLYQKIGSFRGESTFYTWLHRMAVNQVLMHFRRRKSRPEFQADEEHTTAPVVLGTQNPNRMPVVDRIALDKAIAGLPPGYRAAFILHDVEGHEHEEIANLLGCAVGTSKSQLHKARLSLRAALKTAA